VSKQLTCDGFGIHGIALAARGELSASVCGACRANIPDVDAGCNQSQREIASQRIRTLDRPRRAWSTGNTPALESLNASAVGAPLPAFDNAAAFIESDGAEDMLVRSTPITVCMRATPLRMMMMSWNSRHIWVETSADAPLKPCWSKR
jgi:hypothetical protein